MNETAEPAVRVRLLVEDDLEAADRIMRVAFGTVRRLPDPDTTFSDAEYVHTRFRAAPDCAWVAEIDGDIVGSVFAARWGAFGFFGPLTVCPEFWDRRVGTRLLGPVLEALDQWGVRQAGLFTFPDSPKHIGLYQKHGFWPRFLTAVMAKPVGADAGGTYALLSQPPAARQAALVEEIRELTDAVFTGLDLEREVLAANAQGIGDTILLRSDGQLAGMAVCHCGAGSEAGSGVCYVKFGAVRPGAAAADHFEQLLEACEAFAAESGLACLVAGVNTGRLEAYRRMLGRGFCTDRLGISMVLRPESPDFDTPDHYVIDDLR